jgi:hypothetical protein
MRREAANLDRCAGVLTTAIRFRHTPYCIATTLKAESLFAMRDRPRLVVQLARCFDECRALATEQYLSRTKRERDVRSFQRMTRSIEKFFGSNAPFLVAEFGERCCNHLREISTV